MKKAQGYSHHKPENSENKLILSLNKLHNLEIVFLFVSVTTVPLDLKYRLVELDNVISNN